jgi:hypothetical protein
MRRTCAVCGSDIDITPCQECGHEDLAIDDNRHVQRNMAMVVLTATITASVVPFVQSIATEGGKDTYEKIKKLLGRNVKPGRPANDRILQIHDSRRAIRLHLGGYTLREEEADQLFRLDFSDPRIFNGDLICYCHWQFISDTCYLEWDDDERVWLDKDWRRYASPGETLREIRPQIIRNSIH